MHQNDLIGMETITKHWRSSGILIANFEKITHLSLAFHCWIWRSVAECVYQQRLKYKKVKITKYASPGTNYAILTKVKHEKKPVSNLKSMQNVGFEQTYTKFIEVFVP